MRVIADHARATAFLIADGVQPSNEGRGYVLRRIMRRAIRHGSRLGLEEPFLHEVVDRVIELMGDAYPELRENRALRARGHAARGGVASAARWHRGLKTDRRGDRPRLKKAGGKVLSGDVVFFLHDTHGFPWDLTQIIARERGFDVDLAGYEELHGGAAASAAAFGGSGEKAVGDVYPQLRERLGETTFLGYEGEGHEGEGTVRGHREGRRARCPGQRGRRGASWSLDRTPFYGESGGQVGDTGRIVGHGGQGGGRGAGRAAPGAAA